MDKNYIAIVFDGPPSHEAGRFVEVNDSHGKSIDIGTWVSRGDGSWELRIAVDKLKDDNDMTVDTSREAVEKLIERLCNMGNDSDWTLYGKPVVDTLAALLYERDKAVRIADAPDASAATLQALLDERERLTNANANIAAKWWLDVDRAERAEAALEGSEQSRLAGEQKLASVQAELAEANRNLQELAPLRDERIVAWEQRIRDLEATNRKISERSANHHDNAIKWRERAERAEAALEGSEQSRLAGEQKLASVQAERDKLTATRSGRVRLCVPLSQPWEVATMPSEQNTDREALGDIIDDWFTDPDHIDTGFLADAILSSQWLAEHDERVRREAAAEQRGIREQGNDARS